MSDADIRTETFIGQTAAPEQTQRPRDELAPGTFIGPFVILRRLGAGGMGVVYLAERPDQKTGPVAIKVIKRGMDSEEIERRFNRERDMLASLKSHPNIAHFEFADSEGGLSYFVMEFVDGRPIDEYCKEQQLDLERVLRLFLLVAGAVQAAHQRTIVHRDLKPSNILVTKEGTPKLLDFGIAKVLQSEAVETALTIPEMRLLTPRYASPEQIEGNAADVRMDVYSLGVILYELITGAHPHRVVDLPASEAMRRICNDEPIPPSSAESGGKNLMPRNRELQRDLDNILLKALHKDPARRYGSVEQFGTDVERYLEGQPVSARPDTHFYKMRKFVTRHRSLVASSAAFVLLLIGATVLVTWQAHVARVQRAVAERRFSDVRSLANWLVFDFHDRIEKLHGATEARQLLIQRALQYLDGLSRESAGDPGLQREIAESYLKLGDVLGYPNDANLGDRKSALASYKKALAILENLSRSGGGTPEVSRATGVVQQRIGEMLIKGGSTDEAFDHFTTGVGILEGLVKSGQSDSRTRQNLAVAYTKMGEWYESRGETLKALAQYKSSMEFFQALRKENPDNADASRNITVLYSKLGDIDLARGHLDDALANYRSSMEIRERLLAASPNNREAERDLATVYDRISTVYQDQNRVEDALSYERKTLAIDLRALEHDPKNADSKADVASDYAAISDLVGQLGHWREALSEQEKAFQIRKELHALSPMDTDITAEMADSALYAGLAQAKLGRPEAAENLQLARNQIEELHQADPGNAMYQEELAKTYLFSGKAMEALGQRKAALAFYRKSLDIYHDLKNQQKNSFEADARMEEAARGVQNQAGSRSSEMQDQFFD